MVAFSRVAVALSAVSSIAAFSPSFSRPKQCSPFAITWSTSSIFGLAPSALAPPTSISISFIPVQSSQNPYTVDVPCHPYSEELEQSFLIERLPFPHGSQIYAEVHVPGVKGVLTRRRISDVWTVGQHPVGDNTCLESASDRHIFARQVNVIGASFIDANVVEPTEVIDVPSDDSPAAAPTESASTGAAQAVRVIGITTIPADESSVPEEDLEETLPEDELPEDVLLEDPETLPEDPETIDDEYTDEYSYGEEYGSDESTITDPAAENPHYVDEPLEHDETYYEDALPEEDPNAWQDDYYGSGDWVQVDEEGASSYLDESTAVKYDSLEEMVNHANKKWKAWNPVNYYKNDEDNSTLPAEIPHKNDTNSTETEYPEDYELEYSEDYQEDEYLEDVKPESAYDDYESIDDAELAVMPSDATGSLYIALPSAIPV